MFQKGIIEEILDEYTYKVRILRYHKDASDSTATPTSELPIALSCISPGVKVTYDVNDIVIVGFENDLISRPIILGLLNKNNNTENQVAIPSVNSALSQYKSQIQSLNSKKYYSHIRYSDDGGNTFTSLYDYTASSIINDETSLLKYLTATDIKIDSLSSVIYWSAIDENGTDVTNNLDITTTIHCSDIVSYTTKEKVINIPYIYNGVPELYIDYQILYNDDIDKTFFVLTTDINTIGTVPGDYMGIYTSDSPTPSINPNDYIWISFNSSIEYFLSVLEDRLLPRIQRNETYLYGKTQEETGESSGNGLTEVIIVDKENINIHGPLNKDIVFNTRNNILVNNTDDRIEAREVAFTNTSEKSMFNLEYRNGHLTLFHRDRI